MTTKTCAKCGKQGPVAEDETDAGWDEMALDSRGLVARNEYVCGKCLERAEDGDTDEDEEEDEELTAGWVACDYTTGDRLDDVRHGEIRAFSSEADADYRQADDDGEGYDGIRYVHTDGYLYVEQPENPGG